MDRPMFFLIFCTIVHPMQVPRDTQIRELLNEIVISAYNDGIRGAYFRICRIESILLRVPKVLSPPA